MFDHTNKKMIWGALLACIGWGTAAHAGEIIFDFNTLEDGATNSQIDRYMDDVVKTRLPNLIDPVTVTGALAERNYDGDGHVVGCTTVGCASTMPLTLGTSDVGIRHSGYDTFIVNNNFTSPKSDRITITFNNFSIYSISFDYEIFPDGTCRSSSNCGGSGNPNWPDFKLLVSDNQQVFITYGIKPGDQGTSKISKLSGTEATPQFIGHYDSMQDSNWSSIVGTAGVKKLQFVDWPQLIGIDNLVIRTDIPEPATVLLTGIGLTGLGLARRRTKKM